jgi:hypothetical protein
MSFRLGNMQNILKKLLHNIQKGIRRLEHALWIPLLFLSSALRLHMLLHLLDGRLLKPRDLGL